MMKKKNFIVVLKAVISQVILTTLKELLLRETLKQINCSYTYDKLGRLTNRKLNTTTPYNVTYSYLAGATTGSTTNMLAGFTAGADAYTYEYDNNGARTKKTVGGVDKVEDEH